MSFSSTSTITGTNIAVTARPFPGTKPAPALVHEVKRCEALGGQLVAFLHWKDRESPTRKLNMWVPVSDLTFADSQTPPITEPMVAKTALVPVVRESGSVGDFLEDRLRRDRHTASSIYDIHYVGFVFRCWYFAPYHLAYPDFDVASEVLPDAYIDPFSLSVFRTQREMVDHVQNHCARLAPPGTVIYEDEIAGVSVYEIDGAEHRTYCRNLSMLGKSFLECKLVGHDVETYMFYVVCINEAQLKTGFVSQKSARYVTSFYSWEKDDTERNLACIITLPCFQGKGLGSFIISISYNMAYHRGFVGTPERPFSDLGEAAYHRYWGDVIWHWAGRYLAGEEDENLLAAAAQGSSKGRIRDEDTGLLLVTIADIAKAVRIEEKDVSETMLKMGLLHRGEKGTRMLLPRSMIERHTRMVSVESMKRKKVHFHIERLTPPGAAASPSTASGAAAGGASSTKPSSGTASGSTRVLRPRRGRPAAPTTGLSAETPINIE